MARRIFKSFYTPSSSTDDSQSSSNDSKSVKQILVDVLRKTLSVGAVTYHEALEEIAVNDNDAVTPVTPVLDMRDYDLEEAIQRSLIDTRRSQRDQDLNGVSEIELETWRINDRHNVCNFEDEGSSSGTMTPNSTMSRPSTSSGLFQEDLGMAVASSEHRT
eukprot:g5763.t1